MEPKNEKYTKVAELLGMELALYSDDCGSLKDESGDILYLRVERGRLVISASVIHELYREVGYSESAPVITVSLSKTAEVVVNDIKKRILDDAIAWRTELMKRRQGTLAYENQVEKNKERLMAACPGITQSSVGDNLDFYHKEDYGAIQVMENRAKLSITISVDDAVKMLELLSKGE